jgi:hypothetical protein
MQLTEVSCNKLKIEENEKFEGKKRYPKVLCDNVAKGIW